MAYSDALRSASVTWEQAADLIDGVATTHNFAVCTGSSNAYVATLDPAPTAYYDGMLIRVVWNHTNTGSPTINVNSLGAKDIYRVSAGAIVTANWCINGYTALLLYRTSIGAFVYLNEPVPFMFGPFDYRDSLTIQPSITYDMAVGGWASYLVSSLNIVGKRYAVGLSVRMNAALSAGSLTVTLYESGSSTSKSLTLSSGTGTSGTITPEFLADNSYVGLRLTTNGSFSTTATGVVACIWMI